MEDKHSFMKACWSWIVTRYDLKDFALLCEDGREKLDVTEQAGSGHGEGISYAECVIQDSGVTYCRE